MDTFTQPIEQDSKRNDTPKDLSKFKFHSLALVVETPSSFPSDTIKVTPLETLSLQESGKTDKEAKTYSQSHQDLDGSHNSQKDIACSNHHEATWMPLSDSNRDTAPCVYKDETVMLYKFADAPEYYWTTIKRQRELRKKEVVRWSASNETRPLTPFTKATSYYFEMDAINKRFELYTPTSGEDVAFRILGDVAAAQLDVSDNKGNSFLIESSGGNITITAKNNVKVVAGQKAEVSAPVFDVNCPSINLNGEVVCSKGLSITNGLSVLGGGGGRATSIGGDVYVQGNLQARQINSNLIQESGYSSQSVGTQAAQSQAAQSSAQPSWGNGSVAGTPAASPSVEAVPHPSPQTDPNYKVDHAATANASPKTLTGDKSVDAPKLVVGGVERKLTMSLPDMTSIKESVASVGSLGAQVSSQVKSLSSGIDGIVSTASEMQRNVQSTISGVTNQVTSTINTVKSTVMDPINQVTRQVTSTVSGITGQVQSVTSGISNQVNGFLQPINSLSKSITGKAPDFTSQITQATNKLNNKVSGVTGQINQVGSTVSQTANKINSSVSSVTNTVQGAVSQANYAAANVVRTTQTATDAVRNAQSTATNVANQINTVSTKISDASSRLSSRGKNPLKALV